MNKKYFGDVAGALQVTSYFRVGDIETAGGDDTYIVSQKSTNKFVVADTSGAWSEVLTLVDKAEGTLAAGEFMISALEADGTPSRVIRFYNRTVRLANNVRQNWNITSAVELTATGITQANPAVVTVADTTALTTGDSVTITGVVGMTEVNDLTYTITVVNATTFSLDGIDSTAFTLYTSGGLIRKAGGLSGATPDVQAT